MHRWIEPHETRARAIAAPSVLRTPRYGLPWLVALAVCALSGAAGCAAQRVKAETAAAKLLVSDEQENKIGEQLHRQIEAEGVRYLDDREVTNFVDQVAAPLLSLAKKDRPGVDWHVHVIDDPKQVNAFATPGGHLYLFTGLLLAVKNEAELAGVLAHEAGHVVARHSARALVNAYGLQAVAGLALGQNPSLLQKLAAGVTTQGLLLAHSRQEELEADEYGLSYAARAGYDPSSLLNFFDRLREGQGDTSKALTLLSTHPSDRTRIAKGKRFIAEEHLGSGRRGDAGRLTSIQQQLGSERTCQGPDGKSRKC